MEEEIGTAVFVRDKNGTKLTATGEQLYPYIMKIIQANNGLNQKLDEMKGLETGFVKIGCTNTVCLAWMSDIITTFTEVHPGIQLQLFQGSYSDVCEWTKIGAIDLGIISERACEGLEFEALYKDELKCVAPKGYFDKKIKKITPEELENQPFVVQQDSYNKDVNSYLYEHHLEVRANCHILDEQSTIAMVQCGAGLSIMPTLFIKTNTEKGPVITPVKDGKLRVGDLVVVRIELRTDRDLEFVHMKDQRGSGMEPVNVLSRYKWQDGIGYYEATKDAASHFYIDYLAKGTYVFEYELRVQLAGQYQTGIAEIMCMYAPEFNSHSESFMLNVEAQ
jgi:DNA-binding transcriptional LysR family regulator